MKSKGIIIDLSKNIMKVSIYEDIEVPIVVNVRG